MKTKEIKRLEANERNAAYQALSREEKLKRIDAAPGKATRQRKRLENR